ncbi:homoserine O-acetyltransferase MetX [Chloroherpeton thalassium]|nr:homoserine O-acetyltransferase [Chloroherpeton thalassium]
MRYKDFFSEKTQFANFKTPLTLEFGGTLPEYRVAYRSWGKLNKSGDNAILICHALTGSADADIWWAPLFGEGKTFDETKDFIVCSNVLGSCYGTTGPASINPETGKRFGPDFPSFTIRDMVRVQRSLLNALGVKKLKMVIGGSLGGMQALEWCAMYPDFVETQVTIASSGKHSAWCIGLSEAQRQAICADENWNGGHYTPENPPKNGLSAARMIAMCTYRTRASFETRFARSLRAKETFNVESYLLYQGEKLVERFDANAYVKLTQAMDKHDLSRNRGDYYNVLKSIDIPSLIVAINSDILYPQEEQEELVRFMPNAQFGMLYSQHGHDTFLIEMEALNKLVMAFQKQLPPEGKFLNDRSPIVSTIFGSKLGV